MTEPNGNNVKDWVIRSEAPKSERIRMRIASSRGTPTDYMGMGRRCLASIHDGLRYSRAVVEIQRDCKEWCAQIQGKESTYIPEEIFEKILAEIKKEKISDVRKITYSKMRDILKRLRQNRYYEHTAFMINRINGVPTPHFTPELEEKLCAMFKEIQGPFLKHCPVERKNFLSYSYVLHQFFRILGQQDASYLKYLPLFPLLKSREKLAVQDQIFKNICRDLGWPFIPSL